MAGLSAIKIEAGFGAFLLDPNGDQVLDPAGDNLLVPGWQDWPDVLTDPTPITRGSFDPNPTTRVAGTGTMTLTLDNSGNNSAGKVGYYSTDHVNRRKRFANGLPVRINLERVNPYYKFEGRITHIEPDPGLLSRKVTYVTVSDWMDVAVRTPMPRLAVQQSKRDDQVIQTILDAIDQPPHETDLDVGGESYDYSLTDIRDEQDKIVAALQSLMLSGLGRLFVIGGTTSGEILSYQTLSSQTGASTPDASFDNSFLDMKAERTAFKRYKRVRATVYPMYIDTSYVEVFDTPSTIEIPAGEQVSFEIYFRDTSGAGKNRLAVIDVQTLVADTDFKFSSSDGSGNDLNANFQIDSFNASSNSVKITATNTAAVKGYLWYLKVRAKGLYRNDPMTYVAENSDIKESEAATLDFKMPYQGSYNIGRDRAIALQLAYNDELTEVPTINFNAGQDSTHLDYAVELEPGMLVEVVDDVTGVSSYFYLIGYRMSVRAVNDIPVELAIVPANLLGEFCILDYVGRAELNSTAKLGY